jgi:hypothetical protein
MMPPLPPPTDKWRDADTRELLPRWNDSALLAYGRAVAEAKDAEIAALRAALVALYRICRDCDLESEAERPTEDEYNAAMDAAEAALAKERL